MTLSARIAFAPLALVMAVSAAETQTTLPKSSPFMPAGNAAGPAVAANETLEFAGVSAVGKRTDLIFYDKTTKKSHWIGVGETKEGISVVSYDSRREQVVVKVNGTEKTLSLRKGTGPVNAPITAGVAPMPTGFNVAPAEPAVAPPLPPQAVSPATAPAPATTPAQPAPAPAPGTAEGQAKAETEARMLVSDLLEIGMAQRKAYEEAQKRATQGGNTPQAASDATQPAQQQPQPPQTNAQPPR
jgi:hypothetical protein